MEDGFLIVEVGVGLVVLVGVDEEVDCCCGGGVCCGKVDIMGGVIEIEGFFLGFGGDVDECGDGFGGFGGEVEEVGDEMFDDGGVGGMCLDIVVWDVVDDLLVFCGGFEML